MMKRLQPQIFIGSINDSSYPLWGILLGVVVLGVVVIGLRLRLTWDVDGVGDCGLIVCNVYFGLEWGGGERAK